jgi:sugar-specific transcriptional regulator TrmB
LNQEPVIEVLMKLGITETDSQVYIYLAKKGPQTGENIAKTLNMTKQQTYRCLKTLQIKGITNTTLKSSTCFSAIPFEKVLDIITKTKKQEAKNIQKNRKASLSNLASLILGDPTAENKNKKLNEAKLY